MQRKEKKSIRTFSIASFLNDLGGYIVFPVWPIFLTTILGANMTLLGFIDGLGDALVSVSQAASGYFSDRLQKRKIFIWLGYLFGAIARIGYALSTIWPHVIPFRILDRAGKMRDAPRDAIIAEETEHKDRGKNFGFLEQMDKLGAVCGIILCIFLVSMIDYSTMFTLASIPSLIAVILIIIKIREKKDGEIKLHKGIKLRDLTKDYRRFLILSAIFSLGTFSYSFLLIFAQQAGWQIIYLPILFLIFNLFAAIFSMPFGKLGDMIGRKKVIFLSMLFWISTCLIFITTQDPFMLILGFICFGLTTATLAPTQKAFVSELAPKQFKASALGGYQMVIGLCALPASTMAGLLWDNYGTTVPFALSLGLTIIAAIMLYFVKEKN